MILVTLLVFAFILGLLVFVHEFGHFVMAKRAGMKVEEFGFGFPPRLFSVKRGETTYSINWIPLGGFVRILGEDGDSQDPRAFGSKRFWPRISVLLAGVGMNFVLGWFILFLAFAFIGTPVEIAEGMDLQGAKIRKEQIAVVGVQPDSPAEYAGLKPGDVILSVDGRRFTQIEELIEYTKSRAGFRVVYEIKRGREVFTRDATPRVNPPEGVGPVGFAPAKIAEATYSLPTALKLSIQSFLDRFVGIFFAFGLLFKGLFTTGKLIEGLSGPVGIAVLTRDFTRLGFVYLAQFTAVLSINLGIINAFPFPALDGGRVLFLIIEKIRGVKSIKWEKVANTVGFLLLMLLMVAITFRDVNRFSEQFKRLFERIF